MFYSAYKRVLDFTIAALALPIAAIPMAVIAVLIRMTMGSPVLYAAARPGLNGKPFVMFKFRTMTTARDATGELLSDRDRVTPLGRVLRRSSLDELPQLINVLRGDMSLVGPRPLKMEYLPLYTAEQARRHDVRPGITGLAQVRGRNRLSWEERFALDVEYVDHVSCRQDLVILAATVAHVLTRHNITEDGDVDVPMFTGSNSRL